METENKVYVDRDELKAAFEEDGHLSAYVEDMIDSVKPANVRQNVIGTWVKTESALPHLKDNVGKCSCCDAVMVSYKRANFCPNCGASMRPVRDE